MGRNQSCKKKGPTVPFLFPKANSTVLPDPSHFFSPSLLSSPLPTNSFFQNFSLKNGDQPEYIHPYLIKASNSKLPICYPSQSHNSSCISQKFVSDITISALRNSLGPHVISSFSDLSVTLDILNFLSCSRKPFFVTSSVPIKTPIKIATKHLISSFSRNSLLTKQTLNLTNNQTWLIYSSLPISLSEIYYSIISYGFLGIIRIVILSDIHSDYEAILDRYNSCYPVSGEVNFTRPFCIEYKWEMKGHGELLMLAHPLHTRILSSDNSAISVLDSIDCDLVGVVGDLWLLKADRIPVTWHSIKGLKEESVAEIVSPLHKDVEDLNSSSMNTATCPYFYCKMIARAARLALIAEEVGSVDLIPCITTFLKKKIQPWLEDTFQGNGFVCEDKWCGIVSKQGLTNSSIEFGFGI